MSAAVEYKGYRELQRSLRDMEKDVKKLSRGALRDVGKPVADTAEQLALMNIRNIGTRWSRMRVGITSKVIYVAPKERGKSKRSDPLARPKLADLMMAKAMQPALAEHEPMILKRFEDAVDRIANANGF